MTPLVQWVANREALRKLKVSGVPRPWTVDPILDHYRFCNVRRRDDRVSQWLRQHVLLDEYLVAGGLPNFLMFTALCRYVNWPPTIKAIVDQGLFTLTQPLDMHAIGVYIDQRRQLGEKVWTGAYMIRADRKSGTPKGQFISEIVIGREMQKHMPVIQAALWTRKREAVHTVLCAMFSWGTFMAGQVVDDWSWTPLLRGADDTYTWAPMGPGSRRGFNRLVGRPIKQKVEDAEFLERLFHWRSEIIAVLGEEYVDVTLMDVQNCLCEFDKYERVRLGEGRPRSTYRPETRF